MEPSFDNEVNRFVERIDSLRVTMPIMMKVISDTNQKSIADFNNFLTEKGIKKEEREGKTAYLVDPEELTEFRKLEKEKKSAELAGTFIPSTFIVALVSQYDAYIGRLIRVIYHIKPELLSASERKMSFTELSTFQTIDDAKEFIIEKDIETVLRKSHSEQIKWFENKLDIPLTKDLEVWPDFIEVTERRNLFVHTDGVISRQYLNVCKAHGVRLSENIETCTRLPVSLSYFIKACDCIFEMGVKLAHVFWRKLNPDDLENADKNLNELCHNLIIWGNNSLAITMLYFASETLPRHSSEHEALWFKIHKAQALKWEGQEGECRDVLKSVDWSAKGLKFNLARSVLEENYEESVQLMKSIGKDGEVHKIDYKTMPLFKKFRQSSLFLATYEDIFDEKFDGISESQGKLELTTEENQFECLGLDLDQFKFDVGQCIETGIRKCCVGNDKFPPIEIHIYDDELIPSLFIFRIAFEPSKVHGMNLTLTIIINVKLLNFEKQIIQLNCSGALTKSDTCSEAPPSYTLFFEGVFDEGVIWNELDQIFHQFYAKVKEDKLEGLSKEETKYPIWVNL